LSRSASSKSSISRGGVGAAVPAAYSARRRASILAAYATKWSPVDRNDAINARPVMRGNGCPPAAIMSEVSPRSILAVARTSAASGAHE